ncbi:hypothetical protein HPB50_015077 [Hyalomma asiaticum]|uniref:Uncharacterized protein n=1 Tax=Hyalomma asiaticum TaxID=266040 RepID=A0ACB7SVQ6_HYAAI|nr:hypothetical protein HPB50_015077 [Hyalomma asiaticum]
MFAHHGEPSLCVSRSRSTPLVETTSFWPNLCITSTRRNRYDANARAARLRVAPFTEQPVHERRVSDYVLGAAAAVTPECFGVVSALSFPRFDSPCSVGSCCATGFTQRTPSVALVRAVEAKAAAKAGATFPRSFGSMSIVRLVCRLDALPASIGAAFVLGVPQTRHGVTCSEHP